MVRACKIQGDLGFCLGDIGQAFQVSAGKKDFRYEQQSCCVGKRLRRTQGDGETPLNEIQERG